jgi:hypothetical protein
MLTGKLRYRKTWLGKIVLQVEERMSHAARRRAKLSSMYHWRDARAEDLESMQVQVQNPFSELGSVPESSSKGVEYPDPTAEYFADIDDQPPPSNPPKLRVVK